MNMSGVAQIFVLTKREFKKCFNKTTIISILVTVLLAVVGVTWFLKSASATGIYSTNYSDKYLGVDWHDKIKEDIENTKKHLQILENDPDVSKNTIEHTVAKIAILQWYLDNNIRPYYQYSASNLLNYSSNIFPVIILLVLILVAKLIADEFDKGTAIGLYTMPIYRWKVLFSKFAVIVVTTIAVASLFLIFTIMAGWVAFGWDSFGVPYARYVNGVVKANSVMLQSLLQLALNCLVLVFCVMLAMLVALITKNATISAIFVALFYVIGSIIALNLGSYSEWIKYLPFLSMNFNYYFDNAFALPSYMTLGFSIVIMTAYSVVLGVVNFAINRRQIV